MSENRKKIIIFIPELAYGGAEEQCLKLIYGIKNNFELVLVYIKDGIKSHDFIKTGIKIIKIKERISFTSLGLLFQIRKIFKKENPDIVYSWLQIANIYSFICNQTFLPSKKYIQIMSIRFGDIPITTKIYKKFGLYLLKLSYRYSNGIIANSIQGKNIICNKFKIDKKKIIVINNVIDIIKQDNPNYNMINKKNIDIGWIGRFNTYKCPHLLIDAVSLMKKFNKKFQISFFGKEQDISIKELKNYSLSKGVSVRFNGYIDEKEKIYNKIDILVSTSATIEGSSNVALEALSFGLPVVLTNVGDNKLYCNTSRGSLVEVNDSKEIAIAIDREISNNCKDNYYSRIKYINNNFSNKRIMDDYINYFNKLLIK